jgi:hypothetical protein
MEIVSIYFTTGHRKWPTSIFRIHEDKNGQKETVGAVSTSHILVTKLEEERSGVYTKDRGMGCVRGGCLTLLVIFLLIPTFGCLVADIAANTLSLREFVDAGRRPVQ